MTEPHPTFDHDDERRERARADQAASAARRSTPRSGRWALVAMVACVVAAVGSWVAVGFEIRAAAAHSVDPGASLPAVLLPAVMFSAGVLILVSLRRSRR